MICVDVCTVSLASARILIVVQRGAHTLTATSPHIFSFMCHFSDNMFIKHAHMWLCALVCAPIPSLMRAVLRLAAEFASPDEGSTPDGDALASPVYHQVS